MSDMRKMILSMTLCVALVILALVAFECYRNLLAGALLFCSIIPSAVFVGERERYLERKNGGTHVE